MGTYIGKVQIGENGALAAVGSTLYGYCATAASTAAKAVVLDDFNAIMHGVTIFVRFNNGNSVTTSVTLNVNNTTDISVDGDCVCGEGEVLAFTLDQMNYSISPHELAPTTSSVWRWRVTSQGANINHTHSAYVEKTGSTMTGALILPATTNDTNNSAAVTKQYVDDKVAGVLAGADAMIFKGTVGTGGNITTLPDGSTGHTYTSGDTYKVIVAGNYGTVEKPLQCEVGDLIIAINNSTSGQSAINPDHWTVVQGNLDGTVTGPSSAVNGNVAIFDGTTGKLIADSGISIPANPNFNNTSYRYTFSTTTADAYTGIDSTYDDTSPDSKAIASVSNGILTIEEGITFTTTSTIATTTFTESEVQGPTVSSGT